MPSDKIGLILGKGHNNIKKIIEQSGAHYEIDKNAPPGCRDKNFVIRGLPDAVETAKNMILDKLSRAGGRGLGRGANRNNNGGRGFLVSTAGPFRLYCIKNRMSLESFQSSFQFIFS